MQEVRSAFPCAIGAVIDYVSTEIILDFPEDDDFTEDIIYGCNMIGYVMKSCQSTVAAGETVTRYVLQRGLRNSKKERAEIVRFYQNEGKGLLHK